MTEIERIWRRSFTSPDRRGAVAWASENIKFGPSSPFPGYFNVKNVPWTKRWYEALDDPNVRRITISGCPQESGKTIFSQIGMAHQIVNDPCPMGFYADNAGKASQFEETRWRPMADVCKPLADKIKGHKKSQTMMKDGTFLLLLGAEAEANRQSHTLRFIVKDEAWRYENGWSREIDARAKAFEITDDGKIIELGTGGTKGDDFSNNHALGTCEVYMVPCEHCGELYEYKWDIKNGGVFRWDEITNSDGSIDYKKTKETVHIECPHCKGKIFYDRHKQRAAVNAGQWVSTNPDADPSRASFTLPIFVPGSDPREFVEKWLRMGKGRNVGQRQALEDIIKFDLAEFWEDRVIVESKDLPLGDYTREEMMTGKWDRELPDMRLGTADFQHGRDGDTEHFLYVVRAYAANGDSRLVDCGRVEGPNELNQAFLDAGVVAVSANQHTISRMFTDCAFDSNKIYEWCNRFKWIGLRGDNDSKSKKDGQFLHHIQKSKKGPVLKVWKNYSELKWAQIGLGTSRNRGEYAPWRAINPQGCEHMLFELRTGKALNWTVPKDIDEFCPEYAAHINSHAFVNVSKDSSKEDWRWILIGDQGTNPDHLYDCEKMQVGAALIAGVMTDISEKEEK